MKISHFSCFLPHLFEWRFIWEGTPELGKLKCWRAFDSFISLLPLPSVVTGLSRSKKNEAAVQQLCLLLHFLTSISEAIKEKKNYLASKICQVKWELKNYRIMLFTMLFYPRFLSVFVFLSKAALKWTFKQETLDSSPGLCSRFHWVIRESSAVVLCIKNQAYLSTASRFQGFSHKPVLICMKRTCSLVSSVFMMGW